LRLVGHEVRVAHDGLTALEMAEWDCPEIVLLDIGLPGMDALKWDGGCGMNTRATRCYCWRQ
jgi:DNA-binding response OmpR family regulator